MELNLKAYLANVNIRCKTFAEKLEISAAHMTNIMSGKRLPSRSLARLISIETGGQVNLQCRPKKNKEQQQQQNQQ